MDERVGEIWWVAIAFWGVGDAVEGVILDKP